MAAGKEKRQSSLRDGYGFAPDAVRLENITKKYTDFCLEQVDLAVPSGSIMGLIGENGAGKTTMIKVILQTIRQNTGEVYLFGEKYDGKDREVMEQVGVVFDQCCFSQELTGNEVNKVMKNVYKNWQEDVFMDYLKKFRVLPRKKIKDYSKGMGTKLSLACALSHQSRLLVLDEPMSGLDPVTREELLDLFWEFIQEEDHSILISSHIITDLEKVCDYITFVRKGKVLFSEEKDRLLEEYAIVKCGEEQLSAMEPSAVISVKKNAFGAEALVKRGEVPSGTVLEPANMEEIMIYYSRV